MKGVIEFLQVLPPILWAGLAIYIVYLTRGTLGTLLGRLSNLELFGFKLLVSGGQAMGAAIELARKDKRRVRMEVEIPESDRRRALDRAEKERSLLEGAEILWVDDVPSSVRNEARMLRSFGVLITFACTTEEALHALTDAAEQGQRFDLILSDISRNQGGVPPPAQDAGDGAAVAGTAARTAVRDSDPDAGLDMLKRFVEEKVYLPVGFYVSMYEPERGVPSGAAGITDRPDMLLHLVLDIMARSRSLR
jgi:CheY-like chemotaxis protein